MCENDWMAWTKFSGVAILRLILLQQKKWREGVFKRKRWRRKLEQNEVEVDEGEEGCCAKLGWRNNGVINFFKCCLSLSLGIGIHGKKYEPNIAPSVDSSLSLSLSLANDSYLPVSNVFACSELF